ncbi:hypothetical protein LDO26_14305 [Luteimonas sp. BDR2-5]|uniref:hypothetical protein n=1 Tax=Proluteimonas luteida TaxID=2878685 RepID=UPI001E32B5E9|nr:hypothetical protein [Luteimonas sp. BDR2-5]MCD9029367.1 hypothetical protein [Luteimonas sp. BDR2-5]
MSTIESATDDRRLLGAALLGLLFLGAVALLSFPAARSGAGALGPAPMWLLGLPAAAWATLCLLRLPRRRGPASSAVPRRRRPGPAAAQATRRPARRRRPGVAGRVLAGRVLAAAGLLTGLR